MSKTVGGIVMEVYMYSNRTNDPYNAKAIYDDGKVTVLKGSKITKQMKENFRPYASVINCRSDGKIVDEEGIVLKNVEFTSPSGAAQFVSGRSTDGLMAWKITRGVPLRTVVKEEK